MAPPKRFYRLGKTAYYYDNEEMSIVWRKRNKTRRLEDLLSSWRLVYADNVENAIIKIDVFPDLHDWTWDRIEEYYEGEVSRCLVQTRTEIRLWNRATKGISKPLRKKVYLAPLLGWGRIRLEGEIVHWAVFQTIEDNMALADLRDQVLAPRGTGDLTYDNTLKLKSGARIALDYGYELNGKGD